MWLRMWAQVSFVLPQSTHLTDGQTDAQTDRRTAFSWLYRALHYTQFHGKNDPTFITLSGAGIVGIV